MIVRRTVLLTLATVAFVLNPGVACTGEEQADFQYGEAEMRVAATGTWQASVIFPDGRQSTIAFALAPAAAASQALRPQRPSMIASASACSDRQFVRGAAACISSSSMLLDGHFVSGDETYRAERIWGEFRILSLIFTATATDVDVRIGHETRLRFQVAPDGQPSNVELVDGTSRVDRGRRLG